MLLGQKSITLAFAELATWNQELETRLIHQTSPRVMDLLVGISRKTVPTVQHQVNTYLTSQRTAESDSNQWFKIIVPEHAVLKFNICTKEVIQLTTDTEHN
jgi:hypothetical protein